MAPRYGSFTACTDWHVSCVRGGNGAIASPEASHGPYATLPDDYVATVLTAVSRGTMFWLW